MYVRVLMVAKFAQILLPTLCLSTDHLAQFVDINKNKLCFTYDIQLKKNTPERCQQNIMCTRRNHCYIAISDTFKRSWELVL